MPPSNNQPSDRDAPSAVPSAPRRGDDPGAPFPIEVRLSSRASWVLIAVFLVLITLPGLLREISSDRVGPTLAGVFRAGSSPVAERLRGVEQRVDDGAWIAPIRERMQTVLHRVFREGNRKVLIGRDGWLFHRPGVQALTGRGPVLGPTHSVAKDPALKDWTGPIPVILDFATQLQERGIRLVLVPVPDKAALQSAHLPSASGDREAARRHHPDWPRLVEALQGRVEVVELDQSLPYLKDDTHWEAAGARAAAAQVAGWLRPEPIPPPVPDRETDLRGHGVWVLAERDLFMDPTVARANGVEWKRVAFNPMASSPATPATPGDALVVEATLRAKSELLDMDSVVYRDALFTAEFTVDRVVAGTYEPKELSVVLWNFRNRVVQPPARFSPGQSVRLTLVPFPAEGDLAKMPRSDDFLRFDLPLMFAEKAELIGE